MPISRVAPADLPTLRYFVPTLRRNGHASAEDLHVIANRVLGHAGLIAPTVVDQWIGEARGGGIVAPHEESGYELTDAGRKRFEEIVDRDRVLPRVVLRRVADTCVEGLLLALRGAVAAAPLLLLAWLVGLLEDPN